MIYTQNVLLRFNIIINNFINELQQPFIDVYIIWTVYLFGLHNALTEPVAPDCRSNTQTHSHEQVHRSYVSNTFAFAQLPSINHRLFFYSSAFLSIAHSIILFINKTHKHTHNIAYERSMLCYSNEQVLFIFVFHLINFHIIINYGLST